jgi:hypothetical protein
MTLNYVTLILDLYDGGGNPITSGAAALVPSAVLTDTADQEIVTQDPVPGVFHAGGFPQVKLLATDNSAPRPSGWTWGITFTGMPAPVSPFSFSLAYANGATQYLSSMIPVSSGSTFQAYLPLPSGTAAAGQVPVATGSGTASAWAYAPVDWINVVTQCGATGNGSTDDTTAILAAITAAGSPATPPAPPGNGTVYFPAGTYKVSGEIAFTCSFVMDRGAVIKAAPGYTGVLASTPKGTRVNGLTFTGGTFDGNQTAQNCFWAHQMTNCLWSGMPRFQNAVQDDVVIGDPTDTGSSYGNHLLDFVFYRTTTPVGSGYANLWLTTYATDTLVYSPQGGVREIGIRADGGDNKFITPHFSNGPVCHFLDTGNNNVWVAPVPDTPGTISHGSASASSGVSTITDSAIAAAHLGLPVTGTNIPNNAFVGTVTAGVSFALVNASGASTNTTGAVSGITLVGVGFNLQGSSAKQIVSPTFINSSQGQDATCYAVCIGSSVPRINIFGGMSVTGQSSSYRWLETFIGFIVNLSFQGLYESNVAITNTTVSQITDPIAIKKGTLNPFILTPSVSSGVGFVPSPNRDMSMVIPVATSTSGTLTLTFGPSTGAENTILSAVTVTAGQVITMHVPSAWKVIITLSSCTLGTVTTTAL